MLKHIKFWKKVYGPNNVDIGTCSLNIAGIYQQKSDFLQAYKYYIQALNILKDNLGYFHPHVAVIVSDISLLNVKLGFYEEAEGTFELALEMYDKIQGRDHPSTANVLSNMGFYYRDRGNVEKSKQNFEECYRINLTLYGKDDKRTLESEQNL